MDLLIHIVHKIDVRAEKRVEQEYLNEFKRVGNKEGTLAFWFMDSGNIKQGVISSKVPAGWHVAGTGDFNNIEIFSPMFGRCLPLLI